MKNCYNRERDTNIECISNVSLQIDGKISTNLVRESMRILYAEKAISQHVKEKFEYDTEFIKLVQEIPLKGKMQQLPS